MDVSLDHYEKLADLFTYPDQAFPVRTRELQKLLDETCTPAADELREFTEYAQGATRVELEEVYTRSFDVQAVTTLDLGYVLFGDDYKRGELLVNLNREHKEAGVDCGTELSDHLPNVLRLLACMKDATLRDEIVLRILAPALRKIVREFDPENLEKKSAVYKKHHKTLIERSEHHGVIYSCTVKALYAVLDRDFVVEAEAAPAPRQQSQFLSSIGTEMTIECQKGNCHDAT